MAHISYLLFQYVPSTIVANLFSLIFFNKVTLNSFILVHYLNFATPNFAGAALAVIISRIRYFLLAL